jgi:peptide/nickel transport system permease protein
MSVQLSLSAGTAVLAESGLTYLGIGVPSGVPSWGHSLATSVKFINVYPLTVLWPGLIVTCVVVALNLFGDALREAADPVANPALRQVRVRRAEASHAQPGLTEPEPIGLKQAEIRQTEPGQSRLEQEEPSQVKSRQTRLPQPEPMQSKQVRS